MDRPLLAPPFQVQQELREAYNQGGRAALQQAVLNITDSPESDILEWTPPDWTARYIIIMAQCSVCDRDG